MKNHPVAILWTEEMPKEAIHFQENKWGCVVALLKAASQGKIAAATNNTTVCQGGKVGLGFQGYEHGRIEYFLSTGNKNVPKGERYKKTPELARIGTGSRRELFYYRYMGYYLKAYSINTKSEGTMFEPEKC